MKLDDLILVSVDDHAIEPRGAFDRHMPAKFKGREPKVVPGSELQALFGRMLPPPPAPVTKKQPKSSKKAVKW